MPDDVVHVDCFDIASLPPLDRREVELAHRGLGCTERLDCEIDVTKPPKAGFEHGAYPLRPWFGMKPDGGTVIGNRDSATGGDLLERAESRAPFHEMKCSANCDQIEVSAIRDQFGEIV